MKFIALEFEGVDAHAVSTYLCLFEQDFKSDPLDAAYQLKRNLERLVDAKSAESMAVRDSTVISIRDRRDNRVSRRTTSTYPDAG